MMESITPYSRFVEVEQGKTKVAQAKVKRILDQTQHLKNQIIR